METLVAGLYDIEHHKHVYQRYIIHVPVISQDHIGQWLSVLLSVFSKLFYYKLIRVSHTFVSGSLS